MYKREVQFVGGPPPGRNPCNQSRTLETCGASVVPACSQLSSALLIFFPSRNAFHSALMIPACRKLRDLVGSTSPSGSGGGCGWLTSRGSDSFGGGTNGVGCVLLSTSWLTDGSKTTGVNSITPPSTPSTASSG